MSMPAVSSSKIFNNQFDTVPMSTLISQTMLLRIDKSPNSTIVCNQRREEEIKSPNSTIVCNQRREEEIKSPNSTIGCNQRQEEEIKSPNSAGDLVYGLILPREIWFLIGKRLDSRLDVSRFRAVCRTWRSVLPPPFRFPIRVPRPPGHINSDENASYFITEVTFYAANDDTIVLFEEEYRGGGFSASALLHESQIPPNWDFIELPAVTQQSSNLSFLCNAYHVHHASPRYSKKGERVADKCDFGAIKDVLKIAIVCSDGSANINPNYPKLRHLKVVAHLAADRKLAVLSLGGGAMNNTWETGSCGGIAFDDIVNYRGRLYGVESSGRAFVMDYDSLHMTQVAPALSNYHFAALSVSRRSAKWKLMHLAVVSGDLYMFVHEYKSIKIVVPPGIPKLYKLSLRLGKWVEADQDLPGQVFIANMLCNFPVPRALFRGLADESRSCSWPCFQYVRVAVGFKSHRFLWRHRSRTCDPSCLPYYYDP